MEEFGPGKFRDNVVLYFLGIDKTLYTRSHEVYSFKSEEMIRKVDSPPPALLQVPRGVVLLVAAGGKEQQQEQSDSQ